MISSLQSPDLERQSILSPTSNIMSPREQQQTRLIEYMIDNNDFSNYKQRRCVIKGERMSRTLSRSGSKSSTYFMHHHQQSVPNLLAQFNQTTTQPSHLEDNNYSNNNLYFSHQKGSAATADQDYPNNNIIFFSPQVQN